MGLQLDKFRKNPAQLLSLTGFTVEEFDLLASKFRLEWDDYSRHFTLEGKPQATDRLSSQNKCFTGAPG